MDEGEMYDGSPMEGESIGMVLYRESGQTCILPRVGRTASWDITDQTAINEYFSSFKKFLETQ